MSTGARAYAAVLADPAARAFSATGFLARLPLSMTGIGTVLLVSLTTGSFGRAGLITGVGMAVGACSAPVWGRRIDRVGQARVLVTTGTLYGVGVALLLTSVLRGWPLALTLGASALAGLGFTAAGGCVRARWTHRLAGSPLLQTAYAVEAVLDEVVFIVGPLLATFLATSVRPFLGLAVGAGAGVVGALALAAQRSTQPPPRPQVGRDVDLPPLRAAALAPVVIVCWALGSIFGGMEVVVVAYARAAGIQPYTGVLLTCWAVGSLMAGVVVGSITWRRGPVVRLRVGAVLLAASLVPLPFLGAPWAMGALLVLSGLTIAPTLIASVSATQTAVPTHRITEALAWNSTGIAAGVATGAAVLGEVVDRWTATGGFVGLVGFGALLSVAALLVRRPQPASAPTPVAERDLSQADR